MTSAPEGWDDAAVRSSRGHVLQSTAWAEVREQQGWRAEFVQIGNPLPLALVLWRNLPVGGRIAYVPRGPIVAGNDPAAMDAALSVLAKHARENGALFLKVDPEIPREDGSAKMREHGFIRSADIQPVLATLVLDLSPDSDALLAGFEKDTRWSVRQAEKRGVTIREADSDEDLKTFYGLYAVTGQRAGFLMRQWEYYRLVWRTLIDAGLATLRLAQHEGSAVAAAMTWHCGERELYMYGATNDAGRRCFASYGLQWRCISDARERGFRAYDLGGIPADLADSRDTMRGPYHFKKGFGGDARLWAGAHDFVPKRLPYRTYLALEPVYTRALQLLGAVR